MYAFYPSSSGIQNRPKDHIALVDKDDNPSSWYDFVSVGTVESSSSREGISLQWKDSGCVNTDCTWTVGPASAGAFNEGQEILCNNDQNNGAI